MLTTVDGEGVGVAVPLKGTKIPTVDVKHGTVSVVVVTNVEPCAFVAVYTLIVVV